MSAALYKEVSLAEASEWLSYNPETGDFHWKKEVGKGRRRVGDKAGWLHTATGYVNVGLLGRKYRANRLAWLFITGEWPPAHLDVEHENRIKSDNREENLRLATRSQNNANVPITVRNSSGFRGVDWHKKAAKWRATISVSGVRKHIGLFVDKAEAQLAYESAYKEAYGEFACNLS